MYSALLLAKPGRILWMPHHQTSEDRGESNHIFVKYVVQDPRPRTPNSICKRSEDRWMLHPHRLDSQTRPGTRPRDATDLHRQVSALCLCAAPSRRGRRFARSASAQVSAGARCAERTQQDPSSKVKHQEVQASHSSSCQDSKHPCARSEARVHICPLDSLGWEGLSIASPVFHEVPAEFLPDYVFVG